MHYISVSIQCVYREPFDWLVIPTTRKVVLKSVTAMSGAQSVMTLGAQMMLWLSVGSLGIPMMVRTIAKVVSLYKIHGYLYTLSICRSSSIVQGSFWSGFRANLA